MKKMMLTTLMFLLLSTAAWATTFVASGNVGAEVNGSNVTVFLDGKIAQDVVKLIRYRDFKGPNGWKDEIAIQGSTATFDAAEGNSFQLVNSSGHFVLLTEGMLHNDFGALKISSPVSLVDHPKGYKFYVVKTK